MDTKAGAGSPKKYRPLPDYETLVARWLGNYDKSNYDRGLSASVLRNTHVSTDEVYGSLLPEEVPFRETKAFQPNSPYAASKAASDHLVRAWHHTYGIPVITTNCSNNYGPYQFPEKLIPLMIHNALEGRSLPIYGDGLQIRDWLYVEDHCAAIRVVLHDVPVAGVLSGECIAGRLPLPALSESVDAGHRKLA